MNVSQLGAAISRVDFTPEYLTFTNVHESETAHISMQKLSSATEASNPIIYYSKTKEDFVLWDYSSIELLPGESVYMYGDNPNGVNQSQQKASTFVINDGLVSSSGNIQTLIAIKARKSKPITELAFNYCSLFRGCVSLTTAPDLPATNLAKSCYQDMFFSCSGLTTAPNLPATNLVDNCYQGMFYSCSGLTTAPDLPATNLAKNCYSNMFRSCGSLTTAPELPATNLVDSCYIEMFESCTKLVSAPKLPAVNLGTNCYLEMFENCTGLTTAPELPATELESGCYSGMFKGCIKLAAAPALPATTLSQGSYAGMFNGCTVLNEVRIAFIEWPEGGITNWLIGVSETGTFYKPAALPEQRGETYIPGGWTIIDE